MKDLEDEQMIFHDPSRVPKALRNELISLVWVALLPKAEREKLLSTVPTQQLSEAWIGPASVLSILLDSMSAKKSKALLEYVEAGTPNKNAGVLRYLSFEAVKLLDEISNETDHSTQSQARAIGWDLC